MRYDPRTWNTFWHRRAHDPVIDSMTFTPFGLPDRIVDAGGAVTDMRYDSLGRVIRQRTGSGTAPVTATHYRRGGLVDRVEVYPASSIDGNPVDSVQITRNWYNALGWIDSSRASNGRRTSYLRGRNGEWFFQYTGNGSYVARTFDWQGRVSGFFEGDVHPLRSLGGSAFADSATRAMYSGLGMSAGKTLSTGTGHWLEYDNLGRVVFQNDVLLTTRRVFNSAGQLTSDTLFFTDGVRVARRYEYNRRGQRTLVRDTVIGASGGDMTGGRTEYAYQAATGRLDSMTAYHGATLLSNVRYRYDRGGRDTLRTLLLGGSSVPIVTRRAFDLAGRLSATSTKRNTTTLMEFANPVYSLVDDLTGFSGTDPHPNPTGMTQSYSYSTDGLRRLMESSRALGTGTRINSWAYDPFGNRTIEICNSCSGTPLDSLRFNRGSNTLTYRRAMPGVTYRYWHDNNGNRLAETDSALPAGNVRSLMSYTAANRLFFSMTPNPNNNDYAWHHYDANGTRIITQTTIGGSWLPGSGPAGNKTYYVYDGSDVALMLVYTGSTFRVQQRLVTGGIDQVLAGRFYGTSYNTLAMIADHQGSTAAALKPDGTYETTTSYWRRNAFGSMESVSGEGPTTNTQTGFTGASTPHAQGGFTYLRNRWYDPSTGRFLTQDPIGLAGGINLYAYAGNNPITFTDPFGLSPDSVQIGWRPLNNVWGTWYVHFAVRVGGNGQWHGAELLPDSDDGRNNIVPFNAGGARGGGYTWTNVAVPQGQTQAQFDQSTLRSIGSVGAQYAGKKYRDHSSENSNKFIHDVIVGAGGRVPGAAAASPAPRTAPGICGGGVAREAVGTNCSN